MTFATEIVDNASADAGTAVNFMKRFVYIQHLKVITLKLYYFFHAGAPGIFKIF